MTSKEMLQSLENEGIQFYVIDGALKFLAKTGVPIRTIELIKQNKAALIAELTGQPMPAPETATATATDLAAAHWKYVGELSSIIGGFHYQSAFVHGHKHGYKDGYKDGYEEGYKKGVADGQASCSFMER